MGSFDKKNLSVEQVSKSDTDIEQTLEQLDQIGDARESWGWADGKLDYVATYGLSRKHVPALIESAWRWIDWESLPKGDAEYAPIHAWRALGQLGAVEAVAPLLAMQNSLSEHDDDWYLCEFHNVFGMIGPSAISPLADYMADEKNGEYPRISVVEGLENIAKRNPDYRDQVVHLLTGQLTLHLRNIYGLNAFLISALAELGASESAEEIELAFAAERVDEGVRGDWGVIREELGVEGLGIAPIREKTHGFFWYPPNRLLADPYRIEPEQRTRERQKAKKEKAKRKQQKKSRKRNRKAK